MLDAFSQKILRLLQRDARRSVQEISEQVGLSSTPCWRRIKEMEQAGIIQRYTALLDREKLGLHICMIVHIRLNRRNDQAAEAFERTTQDWPQVTECYRTSGTADYVIKIVTTDLAAYDLFLQQQLLKHASIADVGAHLVLKELKYDTELPL
jgi:Lrp/AsnC family leucine-responsive transcriptional regulator